MSPSHWAAHAAIYQIYPRSFQDADGDGVGDLPGITARLPYVRELGAQAVWLSPFYPSPDRDFGYDITDHAAVDPRFGTLEDADALIAEAHRLGLRVLLDYVPNHTSDEHPWFVDSRSSRTSGRRDWYVWRDPAPDGGPPNNWVEETGGSSWELDPRTGQYYLHSHYASQPDLNWRNPGVEEAMFAVLRFWLDRGVDGFRVDVPHLLMKDPELRDNPPNPDPRPNPVDRQHPAFHAQLHVHDRQHPDLHPVFRRMRALLDRYGPHTLLIAELEVGPWDTWRRYFGEQLDEFHLPFSFGLIETPWEAAPVREAVEGLLAAVPDGAWPNWVLGNHDRPRLATRIGPANVRAAALLLLTLPGTATLYYGDELALPEADIPEAAWLDPLGRDATRAPMPWEDGPTGGFCPPDVRPWLPLAPGHAERSVARQRRDPRSVWRLHRELLALRTTCPPLAHGAYVPVAAAPDCLAFLRAHGAQRVLVLVNLAGAPRSPGACAPPGEVLVSTALDRSGPVDPRQLELRAAEGLVVALPDATP